MLHNTVIAPDLRQMIAAEIERYRGSEAIGAARGHRLAGVKEFLEVKGFPSTFEEKCGLSLVPYVFQEANYDDISWTDQGAHLGHLNALFDIDFRVMNQGRRRMEVRADEFAAYVRDCFQIIDEHKSESSRG